MDFTEYDDDFNAAPEPTRGAAVPDGEYTVKLTELGIKTFDDGGRRFEYTFDLDNGLHIWKKEYIPATGASDPKDVKKRGYIMADARAVSGNPNIKFSEFVNAMPTYIGGTFKVTKKTNGKYVNVYINERVDTPVAPAAPPAPAQPALPGVPVASTPFD